MEKKFTEMKIRWKRGDKAAGGLRQGGGGGEGGGTVSSPSGPKDARLEPRKILDFHDFYVHREAISDLFSS